MFRKFIQLLTILISKLHPTRETFVAALCVRDRIKMYYGASLPRAFGPSVDIHIVRLGSSDMTASLAIEVHHGLAVYRLNRMILIKSLAHVASWRFCLLKAVYRP